MSTAGEHETVLLEREDAGVKVEVILTQDCEELWLGVSADDEHRAVQIPPDKVMDAFHHPMLYVEDPAAFS